MSQQISSCLVGAEALALSCEKSLSSTQISKTQKTFTKEADCVRRRCSMSSIS